MRSLIVYFLLFNIIILSSQEINDITLIEEKMVAPTIYEEARINYNNGNEYLQKDDLINAEKCFLKAIEIDPQFIDAFDHLGLVYRRQNRYLEAEAIYRKSIELNPKNSVPYINLSVLLKIQNRFEEARQTYLKVIEFEPDNPEPYYGIGWLYFHTRMYKESIAYLNTAIEKYISIESIYVYDAFHLLGYSYYYLNEWEQSLKCLTIAKEYYKDDKSIEKIIKELSSKIE